MDATLLQSLHASGAHVIAADSGADECVAAGIVPEAIIGDMDSLDDAAGWAEKTAVFEIAEQQSTDFEKCLYSTKAKVTVVLGVTGKRFDHTLAALDAVARHAAGRHIILVDEQDIALAVCGDFSFAVAAGDRVSVHPLQRVVFAHSEGLLYPLDGLVLAPGERTGTSNSAVEGPFIIVPEKDTKAPWLLLVERKYLDALIGDLV